MNAERGEQDAFIRIREVICCCPNAWYWRYMAPELKPKYFMPYWSEARLRRHLEMLKAFGFNSLQISLAPQVALNSGVDQKVWNESVRYMCRTARGLGMRVSQFVWGAVAYNFDKKGCVTLDWHKPEDRARLEAAYRDEAAFAPFVDHVITHWSDPGGPSCDQCTFDTAIEMHNAILAMFRAGNPKIRSTFSTWCMNVAIPWPGYKPWSGYKDPGQVAANKTLDRDSDVAIGLMNRCADGVKPAPLGELKAADLDVIAANGRQAGVWGWYTADIEIEPALHVRTNVLQNYFRSLPPRTRTALAWHSLDDNCHGLNMQNLYVAGHLMQDPSLDAQQLLDEFVRGFVGESNAAAVAAALRAAEQVRTLSRRYNDSPDDLDMGSGMSLILKRPVLPPTWLGESAAAVDSALRGLTTVKLARSFKPPWPVTLEAAEYLDELKAHLEAIRQMLAFLKGAVEVKRMKAGGELAEKLEAAINALPQVVWDRAHTAGLEADVYRRKLAALKKMALAK